MPRRSLPAVLLALFLAGCAPRTAAAPAPAAASAAAASPAQTSGRAPRALYDLVFSLRTEAAEGAAWSTLPRELHAFALGPWECALSALEHADQVDAAGARIERARRLACTHKSGATVQSALSCSASEPLAAHEAAELRRELLLTLSGAPTLRLACEAERVERLGIVRSPGAAMERLCLVRGALAACTDAQDGAAARAGID